MKGQRVWQALELVWERVLGLVLELALELVWGVAVAWVMGLATV
jgi:hypothetical protein